MKKLIYSLIISVAILGLSCNEENLDHLKIPEPVSGGIVDVVFDGGVQPVFNITEINTSDVALNLVYRDQANGSLIGEADIFLYHVSVNGTISDTVLYQSYTGEETVRRVQTAPELMTLIGLDPNAIEAGDRFEWFINEVVMKDGRVFTAANTSGQVVINRGDFNWNVFVGCPTWTPELAAGTWTVTRDDFATHPTQASWDVEIVPGPGANQVTIIDFAEHPVPGMPDETYDVVLTVNPITGAVTVARQPAWHCDNFGCGFGEGRVDGGGFFFWCADFFFLDLQHTVDAGSFGTFRIEWSR